MRLKSDGLSRIYLPEQRISSNRFVVCGKRMLADSIWFQTLISTTEYSNRGLLRGVFYQIRLKLQRLSGKFPNGHSAVETCLSSLTRRVCRQSLIPMSWYNRWLVAHR